MTTWEAGARMTVQMKGCNEEVSIRIKELESVSGHGGLMCDMMRVKAETVVNGATRELKLMLKQTPKRKIDSSRKLGAQREVQFYLEFSALLQDVPIPWILRAEFDDSTGVKALLMEDLSDAGWVQSGYFYGGSSPLNWGKDLEEHTRSITELTSEKSSQEYLTILAFRAAARLHSRFWRDQAILNVYWTRGSCWIQGKEYDDWWNIQSVATESWKCIQQALADGSSQVTWSPSLLDIIDRSVAQISKNYFAEFYQKRRSSPEYHWTLVHGDFHPGNVMVSIESPKLEDYNISDSEIEIGICLLDWEMVGVGCGPQDLGQYIISHVEPGERRQWESRALKAYYEELVKSWSDQCKNISYSMDQCLHDYVVGGVERWIWLLLAISVSSPPAVTQYFHNQIAAFVHDHGVNSANIGAPRV